MSSWRYLISVYRGNPELRRGINDALIALCGWSLPTLAEKAGTRKLPEELPLPKVLSPATKAVRSAVKRHSSKKSPAGFGGLR